MSQPDSRLSDPGPGESLHVGQVLGARLCRVLGLDPNDVLGLDYRWRPNELPTVVATLKTNEGVVRELLHLIPVSSTVPEQFDVRHPPVEVLTPRS